MKPSYHNQSGKLAAGFLRGVLNRQRLVAQWALAFTSAMFALQTLKGNPAIRVSIPEGPVHLEQFKRRGTERRKTHIRHAKLRAA